MFPLRLGASILGTSEGFAHKFENEPNLWIVYQVAATHVADAEHAHLTVISSCNVYTHQGKYYSDKREYACKGVDLPNEIDQSNASGQ